MLVLSSALAQPYGGTDTLWTRVGEKGSLAEKRNRLDEFFDLTHANIDSVLHYVHEMGGYEVVRGVRFLDNPFSPADTFTVVVSSTRATPEHPTRYYWTFFVPEGSEADPASSRFNAALHGTLRVQGNPFGSASVYVLTADTGLTSEDYMLLALAVLDSIRFAGVDHHTTPSKSILISAYPNPFNSTAQIEFMLPVTQRVSLRLYDVLGREVAVMVEGMQQAGTHRVSFDGGGLSSGVYFARLDAGSVMRMQKVVLLR